MDFPLPAVCDDPNCRAISPSPIIFQNNRNVTIGPGIKTRCHKCGGTASILDGTFDYVDGVFTVLSAPERTHRELARLIEILKEAEEQKSTPEEVKAKIKEELPFFASPIVALLCKYGALAEWLSLLLYVLQCVQPPSVPVQAVTFNIQQTINLPPATEPAPPAPKQKKKPGRNSPCPCGSGKKYKKCCIDKP